MNEQKVWKQKAPLVVSWLFFAVTVYMALWSWSKVISITVSVHTGEYRVYLPFLFGGSFATPLVLVIFFCVFAGVGWLFSTRVKFFKAKMWRVIYFFTSAAAAWGVIAAYGMWKSERGIVPFFDSRLENVIETSGFFESIVFEHTQGFYLMLTLMPLIVLFYVTLFILGRFLRHDDELIEKFFEYEWSGQWLQNISNLEQKEVWPDVYLGANSETKELVMMPGRDRGLNTILVGYIGTGKTSAMGIPIIDQDLNHMSTYINDYPKMYKLEDFKTEDIGGRYMSGISVIEPSNDLCQKTLQLVKARGIPDEAITYIDPTNPNTPNINPMRGPVDKVAEVFTQVIDGLSDSKGGQDYFAQAQRTHLKHYIYLLKLHDPDKEVTLDMLLDMYNNPQLVHSMHVELKKTFPDGYESFEDRDERNYWKIIQGIDEWFDLNLLPKKVRMGQVEVPERDEAGNQLYFDAKAEHVQGLRNILNDIGANPLIRRVLFGKSDFDFDRHLEVGGVLLVNTAKGELVDLAGVLGRIVLMNLQNATFRRAPNVSSFHHIVVDEAPDYFYKAFREFPAQSRKYKVIITTIMQTIAQLSDQFGEMYMTTIIAGMRNRIVYAVPSYDAEYFSKLFNEITVYDEGQSEMSVSPLQEDPMSRSGSSYAKVRQQAMSPGDIMYQEAFQAAVQIVSNNTPMPAIHVDAYFINNKEYLQSNKLVEVSDENLGVWLEQRRLYDTNTGLLGGQEILSVEETEVKNAKYYDEEPKMIEIIDETTTGQSDEAAANESIKIIDQAIKTTVDPHPRDPVVYKGTSEPANPIAFKAEGLDGLVESFDAVEADEPTEPVVFGEKAIEGIVNAESIGNSNGYQVSKVSEEAEKFFDKLGVDVSDYKE